MKTLEKIKELCDPHGVEFDAHKNSWEGWHIVFWAPAKMAWGTSQTASIGFNGSLRAALSFVKSELQGGFYEADYETLRITGQLDD